MAGFIPPLADQLLRPFPVRLQVLEHSLKAPDLSLEAGQPEAAVVFHGKHDAVAFFEGKSLPHSSG
jgi:hypothetical protein